MKLVVLGGGGVRSPLLAKAIINRAEKLNINEVVFMDNNIEKLKIYGGIAKKIAETINEKVNFTLTNDATKALTDADMVITTLRVGEDKARVMDEKVALRHGVLGQETTGAGGFAMAMRSIPALKDYCQLAKKYSKPDVLIFNFTNPSGLVTQALRDQGFNNVYGICDGPSGFIKEIEELIGAKHEDMSVECFGLNHLSWFKSIKVKDDEMIHKIIDNPSLYTKTENRLFDPQLIKHQNMLLNGYLYYYYNREQAVVNINKSGKTRGETILDINEDMYEELENINLEMEFDKALNIYLKYYEKREKSYMSIESGSELENKEEINAISSLKEIDGEGYAGVALNFIESYITGKRCEMILSVPNRGSINGLKDNDVVEITCIIDKRSVTPIRIGIVPEIQMSLINQVKVYERLAVKAINEKSIELAIDALMVHPLVNSYTLAKQIVVEYVEVHKKYIGEWK